MIPEERAMPRDRIEYQAFSDPGGVEIAEADIEVAPVPWTGSEL
jgi:hypothetical protein